MNSCFTHPMISLLHRTIVISSLLLTTISSSSHAQSRTNSTPCHQTCGETKVEYPFGFSDACLIRLNCTSDNKSIKIGAYTVKNLTSDGILINLPPKCNRGIDELSDLFGSNYAPTWHNGLLLDDCSSPVSSDCGIPTRLVRSLGYQSCNSTGDSYNVSCRASDNSQSQFLNRTEVKSEGNCTVLFSSVMLDASSVSLDFWTMELGWWLQGEVCNCSSNANCTKFLVPQGQQQKGGYRCRCNEGYEGDGFTSCSKVPECTGGKHWHRGCGEHSKVTILVGGVVGGASLAAITGGLILYCLKRRSKTLRNKLSAKHLLSEAACNSSVPLYSYKEIERATNGFSEKQRLGTGAYGTVYAGKLLHNDEFVAIKKMRYHDSIEQVMNEIKLLSSVSHPNLVRLLGCCIESGEQILVYEYMPNGTLSQHLQRDKGGLMVLPWTVRLTIAAETAHAIAHLHSAPIYHRDIKSSNILLDYNFNSKVADFGLSRFGMTDDSHVSTAPQGTPGYVDPQYHQNFHLSDKSDVYSFGVVLVEIITAKKVVDFSRPHSEVNLAALAIDKISKGRVDEIIDPYLEPNRDAWTLSSLHKVAELAFRCLAYHRDMRPSMMEVADELEQIRVSAWAPLDENINMGSSVASSCSSPYIGKASSINKVSKRVAEMKKEFSPVSVHDNWLSEQSSPSTNSLLGNVVK